MERMRLLAFVSLMAVGMGTGCSKKAPAPVATNPNSYTQAAVAAGGTSNANGSVTNANGSVTEPDGTVLPATSSPAPASASGPTTAVLATPSSNAPAPVERVAPTVHTAEAGTAITIRTTEEISSKGDGVGQRFTGVLERPVVSHGTVVFERGTPVAGEVVGEKNKGTFKGAGDLAIVLTAIGQQPVKTSEYVQVDKGRGKRTGALIGGGGGLGALIGGIAGGGKGALIGAAAGAGAGTIGSTTGNKNVIIRPESVITFRLRAPVSR